MFSVSAKDSGRIKGTVYQVFADAQAVLCRQVGNVPPPHAGRQEGYPNAAFDPLPAL
jgi:hypothetical protein